ncbi:MAG: AAA family ATPase [Bacteroidales bacterium]|nr:AAA family ATPase [Bacteroidales bacterium]
MFKRKIIDNLQNWRNSRHRKPLILRGARQVGKSTAVDMFGADFPNYLSFNLEDKADLALFERNVPLDNLVTTLFAVRDVEKREGETLIFIDEIQNSPMTMAQLRFFKERRPDLHVIAAGSLLENKVDMKATFPVGRVNFLAMRPCSFYEFMDAMGHASWRHFIDNPEESQAIHDRLMALFNQYAIVGGMPEVVEDFVENRDMKALEPLYETLIQGYLDDVEKYVKGDKLAEVVRFVIEAAWSMAGAKVTLDSFAGSQYKAREVGEACRLLNKAMLLERAYPTTSTVVPALVEMRRKPKLLMLDTGLTNYKAGVRKELIGASDILDVWRGRIAEQIVGQELLTLSDLVSQKRSFWTKGNDVAEMDFVLTYESSLIPIEVKNGHNSHLRSLHSFIDDSPLDIGVRVWAQPFSVDEVCTINKRKPFRLINLPFYLVGNLPAILSKFL